MAILRILCYVPIPVFKSIVQKLWDCNLLLALIDEGARLRHVGVIRVFHQPPTDLDEIEQLHLIAIAMFA